MRSRERACTCLHRVWCGQSRICLLSRQCGTSFSSVRGTVWRRGCGRSPPPTVHSRLHRQHTREEVGEVEDVLRGDSYGPLCLDSCLSRACTCRAVRERDVQNEGMKE